MRNYTHEGLVNDAFALLDHLQAKQSYVFGSSFGSTIALGAMRNEPTRIPRAVLSGGFAQRPLTPPQWLLAKVARCA
jgi:pimeloyl-ACP methyl ester carboxylesterase